MKNHPLRAPMNVRTAASIVKPPPGPLRQPCTDRPTLADIIMPAATAFAAPSRICDGLSMKKNGRGPIPVLSAVNQPKYHTDCTDGETSGRHSTFGRVA